MLKLTSAGATGLLALLAVSCQSAHTSPPPPKATVIAPRKAHIEFDHGVITAMQVRDLASAKKWYGEMLGCGLVYELPEHGWCELSTPVDNCLIGLAQTAPGEQPAGTAGASFSFAVKNIEAARASLFAAGVKTGEVTGVPGVVKLLEFTDPDGNKLMLYEAITN